jgi:hypothetical protein
LDSKKVIHKLPCLRWKLTETVLFRGGNLGLTNRWEGTQMKDISSIDWDEDTRLHTIGMRLPFYSKPVQWTVRKFIPLAGDSVARHWVDSNGVARHTQIEPYCLYDIRKAGDEYRRHVASHGLSAMLEFSGSEKRVINKTGTDYVRQTIRQTYRAA